VLFFAQKVVRKRRTTFTFHSATNPLFLVGKIACSSYYVLLECANAIHKSRKANKNLCCTHGGKESSQGSGDDNFDLQNKKALKKSVLFTLVPQPEALIGFFGFLISPQGSKLTGHALAKQPPAITLEAVAFNLKIID